MKVHGCSRENENELKERKNERLSHLGPINNHYREEKWVLFVQHRVQGALMVVLGEERTMKKCVEGESFNTKEGLWLL